MNDETNEVIDCTFCTKFLLCKKSAERFDCICEKFEDNFPDDLEPFIPTVWNNEDDMYVCDHACKECAGCPCAIPHEWMDLVDKKELCEVVNKEVCGIKVNNGSEP
jgi:hypothetical protein